MIEPFNAALFAAVRTGDVDAVRHALAAGANPRATDCGETPLHAAARRGPLPLVEELLRGGALEWQPNADGHTACDVARANAPEDRAKIVALLDRGTIADLAFREAVAALHAGDAERLAALLDAKPYLLTERIEEPAIWREAKRHQYFHDPKLFWFVANNPRLVDPMPANIGALARLMLDRGIAQADRDYALELVMSGAAAREQGLQEPLMSVLLAAGARASPKAVNVAGAHRECDALRTLLAHGYRMSAPIAAALGMREELREVLKVVDRGQVRDAFALAVINGRHEAAEMTLAKGANVNAFLPVHAHSTALHNAANDGDVRMIALLLAAGAHTDTRDLLWDGTPLDWALHAGHSAAAAALRGGGARR